MAQAFNAWGKAPQERGIARMFKSPLTKSQKKLLELLQDGRLHSVKSIMEHMGYENRQTLSNLLTATKKILRLRGQDIHCVLAYKRQNYCWVRHLQSKH